MVSPAEVVLGSQVINVEDTRRISCSIMIPVKLKLQLDPRVNTYLQAHVALTTHPLLSSERPIRVKIQLQPKTYAAPQLCTSCCQVSLEHHI